MGSSWQVWVYLLATLSSVVVPQPVLRAGVLCAYGVHSSGFQNHITNCLSGICNSILNLACLKWNSWILSATCSSLSCKKTPPKSTQLFRPKQLRVFITSFSTLAFSLSLSPLCSTSNTTLNLSYQLLSLSKHHHLFSGLWQLFLNWDPWIHFFLLSDWGDI